MKVRISERTDFGCNFQNSSRCSKPVHSRWLIINAKDGLQVGTGVGQGVFNQEQTCYHREKRLHGGERLYRLVVDSWGVMASREGAAITRASSAAGT